MEIKNKNQIFTALIAVLISVTLVAAAVYAATTIGNDVSVGGDLTVTGNSIVSGDATTTGNQVISGKLVVTGTSTMSANSKIEMGTIDQVAYNRRQIWNSLPNSIIRLGALFSDGDGFNTTSEGIIVYGQNAEGDNMDPNNWGYARIKPDRFGLFNKKDGVYEGYLFRIDLSSDDFYLKDNSGSTVFDFIRATGQLYISGSVGVASSSPSATLGIDGTAAVTGTTTLALTSGNLGVGTSSPASLFHVSKNSATTTVTIGNASGGSPACLKLRDSDDAGWTYCTVLNGSMNCTTTSCE